MKRVLIIFCLLGFVNHIYGQVTLEELVKSSSFEYLYKVEVIDSNLYKLFDNIIEQNKTCMESTLWKKYNVGSDYFFRVSLIKENDNIKMSISAKPGKIWLTEEFVPLLFQAKDSTILLNNYYVCIYKDEFFRIAISPEILEEQKIFRRTKEKYYFKLATNNDFSLIIYKEGTDEIEYSFRLSSTYIYINNKFICIERTECDSR